jgi:hypothetical protein
MDTLTFVARLIEAVAWPISALAMVCILRGPLLDLMRKLSSIKYGDVEANFQREIKETKKQSEAILSQRPAQLDTIDTEIDERISKMVDTNPRACLHLLWTDASAFLWIVARQHEDSVGKWSNMSVDDLVTHLYANGLLGTVGTSMFLRFKELYESLRNLPSQYLSPELVRQFADLQRDWKSIARDEPNIQKRKN